MRRNPSKISAAIICLVLSLTACQQRQGNPAPTESRPDIAAEQPATAENVPTNTAEAATSETEPPAEAQIEVAEATAVPTATLPPDLLQHFSFAGAGGGDDPSVQIKSLGMLGQSRIEMRFVEPRASDSYHQNPGYYTNSDPSAVHIGQKIEWSGFFDLPAAVMITSPTGESTADVITSSSYYWVAEPGMPLGTYRVRLIAGDSEIKTTFRLTKVDYQMVTTQCHLDGQVDVWLTNFQPHEEIDLLLWGGGDVHYQGQTHVMADSTGTAHTEMHVDGYVQGIVAAISEKLTLTATDDASGETMETSGWDQFGCGYPAWEAPDTFILYQGPQLEPPACDPSAPPDLWLGVDRGWAIGSDLSTDFIRIGDEIIAGGCGFDPAQGEVTVQMLDSMGDLWAQTVLTSDADGRFQVNFSTFPLVFSETFTIIAQNAATRVTSERIEVNRREYYEPRMRAECQSGSEGVLIYIAGVAAMSTVTWAYYPPDGSPTTYQVETDMNGQYFGVWNLGAEGHILMLKDFDEEAWDAYIVFGPSYPFAADEFDCRGD